MAVGRRLLLALLREEVVDLIIIARAAAQTLPHQRRAHKVGLCMGGKHIFLSYWQMHSFQTFNKAADTLLVWPESGYWSCPEQTTTRVVSPKQSNVRKMSIRILNYCNLSATSKMGEMHLNPSTKTFWIHWTDGRAIKGDEARCFSYLQNITFVWPFHPKTKCMEGYFIKNKWLQSARALWGCTYHHRCLTGGIRGSVKR